MIRGQGGPVGAQMIDATTGGAFSGSVTAFVTLDAGTQTAATNACTNEGNGYYTLTLTSPETDGELVAVTFVGSGAVPATIQIITTAAVPTPAPITSITGAGVTTALTLITDAFDELNVFQPGESIPAVDGQKGLRLLNAMIGSWAQQNLTIPAQIRYPLSIVADQSSYTVGTGGDLDIPKPPNQNSINGVSLVYGTSSPPVEIQLGMLTDEGYRTLAVKTLSGTQPSLYFYNPTYSATFGTLYLWPVPNTTVNSLALYLNTPLSTFADLTSTYAFPDAYQEALTYQLARRLAAPYGREVSPDLADKAIQSLATIKRANTKIDLMGNAFAGVGWWDFRSGQVFVRN